MKNIKSILLGGFAVLGFMTVITGFTNQVESNEVGTYQISGAGYGGGVLYRLNTKTGDIVEIKQSNIDKVNLNKK